MKLHWLGVFALVVACTAPDVIPDEADGGPPDAAATVDPDADPAAPDAPAADAAATPDACLPAPEGEVCNGLDDDCDGTADEGFPGVGADCDVGVGACERNGSTVCTPDGTGVACSAVPGPPSTERCATGLDEDCDGEVDEGFPDLGMPCTEGVGACLRTGSLACAADGVTLDCDATPGAPAAETCNAVDDDCDGPVDETFADLGDPCTAGIGACAATGTRVCNPAGTGTQCDAAPGTGGAEACNNVDDDCDGAVDDGDPGGGSACTTSLPGACAAGTMHCTGGAVSCVANTMGGAEVCNGTDDDCDGSVDEGYGVGSACDGSDGDLCAEGTVACNGAGGTTCSDSTPTNGESCDGLDNDCDGAVDEGYGVGTSCDGPDLDLCFEGALACNPAGTGTVCNDATGNSLDVCNGVDDDCNPGTGDGSGDGTVGTGCDGGDGDLCAEGTWSCAGGTLSCSDTTPTTNELCNGADDDCDGAADEGFGVGGPCDGWDYDSCQEGTIVCDGAGGATCDDGTGNNLEACNSLDDDCDGTVDEGCAGAGCAHSECVEGGSLATCSACATTVCATDPYCCANAWDSLCQDEAETMCGVCAVGTCGTPLCGTSAGPLVSGCDVPPLATSCVATVCASDPWCCNNNWDSLCAGEARDWCALTCY